MKKLVLLSTTIIANLFAYSQNLTINGEIEQPTGSSVYLYISNPDRTRTYLDSAALDENGRFQLKAELENTTQVVFTDGNENTQLIASPGDALHMTVNTRFFDETMSFTGKGAEKYTALSHLYLINETITQTLLNSVEKADTTEAIATFNTSYDVYLLLAEDYKLKHTELEEYITTIQNNAQKYRTSLINYYRSEKEFSAVVNALKNTHIVDFKGVNLEGKTAKLSDFKGKLTVLDFWATWCGPCRAEFPAYKKLEEKYGEEINFVSVGVFCKEEEWKKMASKEGFKNNIFLSKEVQDQIKELRVDFIPRYIVLDENHKIIDAMAPRPSSGKLQGYWE